MKVNKEKIWFFLQFFFDKGENASQAAEIANGVYGANTVTVNYMQFWFRRFRSGATPMHTQNMMDRISICEALAKRNETDLFLKRMVTGEEKWVTYYNTVRKRSWSKCGEAVQTAAKPGLTARKVLL
ncbi:histone-lysine N-methyltransferase SETMAR [Trichonephila clavipes]|nr:histone-lysine N-methyltransferase SETMAR [Trichonephila clavipes]